MAKKTRSEMRKRRHIRVRKKIAGTSERPRLNVFRSLNQIYAQVIDDSSGRTMVSVSTLDTKLKPKAKKLTKTEQAKLVGEEVAKRAKKAGITKNVSPYIIKPSSITLDFNNQVNPKIIQRKARHKKIETTLRYDHVSDEMVKKYFEKMNAKPKYLDRNTIEI